MREIKFRAKNIVNGKWVCGYYLKHETRQISPIGEDKLSDDEVIHLIAMDGFADWNMPRQVEFYKVDPKTVGQYTGRTAQLTDKIYEGDICEVTTFDHNDKDTQHECVVKYIDGSFGFSYEGRLGEVVIWLDEVYDTDSQVKVIGNIHDNKGEEHGE